MCLSVGLDHELAARLLASIQNPGGLPPSSLPGRPQQEPAGDGRGPLPVPRPAPDQPAGPARGTCPWCGLGVKEWRNPEHTRVEWLCGSGYFGSAPWQAPACRINELEALVERAERERDAAIAQTATAIVQSKGLQAQFDEMAGIAEQWKARAEALAAGTGEGKGE